MIKQPLSDFDVALSNRDVEWCVELLSGCVGRCTSLQQQIHGREVALASGDVQGGLQLLPTKATANYNEVYDMKVM